MSARQAAVKAPRSQPSAAPGAHPAQCRWCPTVRDCRGIRTHERTAHPAEYQRAKDLDGVPFAELAERAVEPPAEHLKKYPEKHGKTRPPDPALDDLLARLDSNAHTAAGIEMLARASARTPQQRDALRHAHPVFGDGVYGLFAYRITRP